MNIWLDNVSLIISAFHERRYAIRRIYYGIWLALIRFHYNLLVTDRKSELKPINSKYCLAYFSCHFSAVHRIFFKNC